MGLVLGLDESLTAFWNRGGRPLLGLVIGANGGREVCTSDSRALRDLCLRLKALKVKAVRTGILYKARVFSNKGINQHKVQAPNEKRRVSITKYFYNTYIRLQAPHLQCVRTHPDRDAYLPMGMLIVKKNQRLVGMPGQAQARALRILQVASLTLLV